MWPETESPSRNSYRYNQEVCKFLGGSLYKFAFGLSYDAFDQHSRRALNASSVISKDVKDESTWVFGELCPLLRSLLWGNLVILTGLPCGSMVCLINLCCAEH